MFKTNPQSAFYPARVAGKTSTGMARVEWYQDNLYERMDKPIEIEFVCSLQDCANAAAANPDLVYDKVGAISHYERKILTDLRTMWARLNGRLD
jgi:hypothetical protein